MPDPLSFDGIAALFSLLMECRDDTEADLRGEHFCGEMSVMAGVDFCGRAGPTDRLNLLQRWIIIFVMPDCA